MTTAVHRHRLGLSSRCGLRARFEAVAPGGKNPGVSIERLEQESDHQLGEDPRASDVGRLVREAAELEQLLEALEGQLDLPAIAIEFEDLASAEQRCGNGGEHHHEMRRFQRTRIDLPGFLARLLGRCAFGLGRRRGRKFGRNHAPRMCCNFGGGGW